MGLGPAGGLCVEQFGLRLGPVAQLASLPVRRSTCGGQGRRFGGLAQMLEEASDVLWLLDQGLEFHVPATLGAFLDVLGESSFKKLALRAID